MNHEGKGGRSLGERLRLMEDGDDTAYQGDVAVSGVVDKEVYLCGKVLLTLCKANALGGQAVKRLPSSALPMIA